MGDLVGTPNTRDLAMIMKALLVLLPAALAQNPIEKVVDEMLKGETGAPQASPHCHSTL